MFLRISKRSHTNKSAFNQLYDVKNRFTENYIFHFTVCCLSELKKTFFELFIDIFDQTTSLSYFCIKNTEFGPLFIADFIEQEREISFACVIIENRILILRGLEKGQLKHAMYLCVSRFHLNAIMMSGLFQAFNQKLLNHFIYIDFI